MSNDLYQRQLEKAQKRLEHASTEEAGVFAHPCSM